MIDAGEIRMAFRCMVAVAAVLVISACADPAPTFTAGDATAQILAQFPDAELSVGATSIDAEGRGVAQADFNGQAWSFYFQPAGDAWELEAIDVDGSIYYIRDLEQISATMESMGALATALGRYRVANETYPQGDSAAALQALIPDFIPADTLLHDAWSTDLEYESDGDDYTLISYGADQQAGTNDDIVLHTGEFVGAGGGQGQEPAQPR